MAKTKTVYFCQNCGTESPKWIGKCPSCGQWNTYVEETIQKEKNPSGYTSSRREQNKPVAIKEVVSSKEERIIVPDQELNRVLGGGIVPGSLVLIGGEPGIGKSTLMLQIALKLQKVKVLYVSGEESAQQIKMRADRMENQSDNCYILTETITSEIFKQIEELAPELLVIDSIQTLTSPKLESAAGSVGQVKECTAELMRFAKENKTPVLLIGHITKDGAIAGPKVLEHMVDAVLQFEGDRHLTYRILRTTKNRFGSTNELGIYEMQHYGLREVTNPSEILISQKEADVSGTAIGATLEGNRPLLIEIQALVSTANYGTPQRSATGFDNKRMNMLLAVLEKRGGFRLGVQDVFLNMAGGIRVEDPAVDLAVCMAVVSSLEEIPVSAKTCMAAEVGLGGEIRAVNRVENRIAEAEKLGFDEILVSQYSMKGVDKNKYKITIKTFTKLTEVVGYLFG
ncbi:DNA repair protein RadA [Marivirga atlantica]|jgi:DNA repair protein RadA/Sms|uniref:DNA repair protein RadA n=1 Tax=Marivirga atlantica TaxID=1548457 RepID=A0A937AC23_9BACT|nr:DNA repair protein RadA [Marivirga atlantica]MBL0763876.1 DNA repair protein RadA [Marivirga atlantica]